jgi:hypothetical protein
MQDLYNGNPGMNYPIGYRDDFDQKVAYLLITDLAWSISVLGACESFGVGPSNLPPSGNQSSGNSSAGNSSSGNSSAGNSSAGNSSAVVASS